MRKNTARVMTAWAAGKDDMRDRSLWTDGQSVYSYATAILAIANDGMPIVNVTRYSNTTTNHQNGMRYWLDLHGRVRREVTNIPRGVSDVTLANTKG